MNNFMNKIMEVFNFDNIGEKIKNLAKVYCWVTNALIWIAAPIVFIVLLSDEWTASLCWIPLVSAIFGPFIIWIGSWGMYALGELVEDVHAMRNKSCPIFKTEKEKSYIKNNRKKFTCPKCGKKVCYGTEICECGQEFDWSEMQL